MSAEARFQKIWTNPPSFRLSSPEREHCEHARAFSQWVGKLTERVNSAPSPAAVALGKLALVDKFFEWEATVPREHKAALATPDHPCIIQVFADGYRLIRAVELALAPPEFLLPPVPPPSLGSATPPPEPGVAFGDIVEDEE